VLLLPTQKGGKIMEISHQDLVDMGVIKPGEVEEVSVWPMLCAALGVFALMVALVGAIIIGIEQTEKPVAVKCPK
jgi:hypothetical protein